MNRLKRAFAAPRPALIAYVCGGDPSLEETARIVPELAEAGADVIEIGIPFSDPIADGPTLQAAAGRAIKAGATASGVLRAVEQIRAAGCEVPIVLMTYLNPILSPSLSSFCERAAKAGADALLIPDLPLEEAVEVRKYTTAAGLALPLLAAPTTADARLAAIGAAAEGFLYYVSVTGVTGAKAELPADLPAQLDRARRAARVPVVVGFGISTPEQARALATHCDGVVVGSAIVNAWTAAGARGPVVQLVRSLADAVHSAAPKLRAMP